jgi:hypothetical protein
MTSNDAREIVVLFVDRVVCVALSFSGSTQFPRVGLDTSGLPLM